MIMASTMLTATTKPLDLTNAIEAMLKPFGKIGFNYHDIALMISIALRFIPTIIEEALRIMNAQKAVVLILRKVKLKEKVYAMTSLIVLIFFRSF